MTIYFAMAKLSVMVYDALMATGESILKKMHEYEAKVLTALGFKPDDPVLLHSVELGLDGHVVFAWYGPEDPVVEAARYRPGVVIHALAHNEAVQYRVHHLALDPEVWGAIVEARREWESNFPTVSQ